MNPSPTACIVDGSTPFCMEANGLPMWKCRECGLMWRQSFDVSIDHYADAEGGFSEEKNLLQLRNIRDRIRTLRGRIDLNGVCDVGGSKGCFVKALVALGYSRVYGLDPNKRQVDRAKAGGIPMHLGTTEDAVRLSRGHATGSMTMFHVIEHLQDPEKVLGEIRSALPRGGHLVIETPDFDSYIFRATGYRHKLVYPEHTFYFNRVSVQRLLAKSGFAVTYFCKRDFDQYNLNIYDALSKLGVFKNGYVPNRLGRFAVRALSPLLRKPLSLAVKFFGRQNFMLLVAEVR